MESNPTQAKKVTPKKAQLWFNVNTKRVERISQTIPFVEIVYTSFHKEPQVAYVTTALRPATREEVMAYLGR
jgi:hypothetical protein